MIVRVTIDGQEFSVEVSDVRARPVVAVVDGERFEVWPEAAGPAAAPVLAVGPAAVPAIPAAATRARLAPDSPGGEARAVRAPIPGVIVSVAVEAGSQVSQGQELCALEAMKMKNLIRAPRAATIARVAVAVGQHVKHRDLLIEFAD
jgi:biotin carboxyl carrier protein